MNFLELTSFEVRRVYSYFIPNLPVYATKLKVVSPFRQETHPSLSLDLDTGLWYDFGMGQGGNAVQFIALLTNCSTKEAHHVIARILNGTESSVSSHHRNTDRHAAYSAKRKEPQQTPMPMRGWIKPLCSNPNWGVPGDEWRMFAAGLGDRGISIELCLKYGWSIHEGVLMVPYDFEPGQVESNHYKSIRYVNGSKRIVTCGASTLYPQPMLNTSGDIIICEGEYDVLSLIGLGYNAITGTAGCSTWKSEWSWAMSGRDVFVLYDADEPGRAGAHRVSDSVKEYSRSIKIIDWGEGLPKGYDVGDYIKGGGDRSGIEQLKRR